MPPDLPTFVTSPAYLGQPPLSPRQERKLTEALGKDPTKVFDGSRTITQAALMLGKGAGKDLMCSYVMCSYVLAWLSCIILCLTDPLAYFEFPSGESLDMLNVACSAEQANKVFFTKLKQRISRPWFQRFNPKISDGSIEFPDKTQPIPNRPGEYTPLLRLFSGHSKTATQEGKNLIAWVMDEAAAFRDASENSNAEDIHKMLVSSARSRFANRFFGLIISYPPVRGLLRDL